MTVLRLRIAAVRLVCALVGLLGSSIALAQEVVIYYDYVENGRLRGGVLRFDEKTAPASFVATSNVTSGPWTSTAIVNSGPSGNRIDLAIVGDGYTAMDLPIYIADAENVVNGFFTEEPLTAYASCFNVHRVDVLSNESGVDEPSDGIFRDTALDMAYDCAGTARLLCVHVGKATAAALAAPQAEQILALANSTRYGGAGYPSSHLATLSGRNPETIQIALHEFGHSFADLADEYDYGGATTYAGPEPPPANVSIYTAAQQFSLQTKWHRWLDLPGVDTFEGAFYSQFGIYRPTNDSKMRSLNRPFESVNVEQFVISIYRTISPVDNVTPFSSTPLAAAHQFFVTPIQPIGHSLSVQWSIDGTHVPGATQPTFVPMSAGLTAGIHDVAVRVVDNTPRVRDETARETWMTYRGQWQVIADCNTNGVSDVQDIASGTSGDCNLNQLPDECEPDGDEDSVPDVCDICPGFDDHQDLDGDSIPNGCDACPDTFPSAPVNTYGCPTVTPCDFNGDGDVDQSDFGRFQACLSGRDVPQTMPACQIARIDADSDVDSVDFNRFRNCYSGPGVPADSECANP